MEPLLNLEISTTVKQPELVASKMRIDFGQIAVGQAHVEELRVKNMSPSPMMLETVSPHTVGPYSVLNAARPLAADGGSMVLKVQFAPLKQLKFFEKLHLRTDAGFVDVSLVGQGVSPVLSIEPADGHIELGHVVRGERSTGKCLLRNCSVFPLRYTMDPLDEVCFNVQCSEVIQCCITIM